MSIFGAISALVIGVILSLALRSLKLSAPFGMSLLLPLCFILNIETVLLVLIVMDYVTSFDRTLHAAESRSADINLQIAGLSSILIVFSLTAFQFYIDKVQFLALCVFSITAVICFQALIMPIPSDNKLRKPRILSLFLSMLSAITGLTIPTIGMDVGTGIQRYSMGITELYGGIDFTVIVLGLCCLGEILYSVSIQFTDNGYGTQNSVVCGARQTAGLLQTAIRRPYFKVAEILLAATLGIPLSQASAIIVGTFALYGSQFPNPIRFLFYNFNEAYTVALISVIYIILLYAVPMLSKRMPGIPHKDRPARAMSKNTDFNTEESNKLMSPVAFYPILTVAAFVGVYSIHYRLFDIYLLIAFGVAGFIMRRLNFPITPLLVCAAFSYRIEEAYRAPFSWTYLTAVFYLLSCIVLAIYIKMAFKPDGND